MAVIGAFVLVLTGRPTSLPVFSFLPGDPGWLMSPAALSCLLFLLASGCENVSTHCPPLLRMPPPLQLGDPDPGVTIVSPLTEAKMHKPCSVVIN